MFDTKASDKKHTEQSDEKSLSTNEEEKVFLIFIFYKNFRKVLVICLFPLQIHFI